jgi:type IV pilus assembly protein PilC
MLRWYPLLIPVVVLPVYFLIMIFVMPKFKQLFADFGLKLPGITLWLLNVWYDLAVPLVCIAVLAMAAACARLFADLFPFQRRSMGRVGPLDRLAWSLPPWRGVVRNRALADACHVIADALDAGQPADRAILDAAEVSPNAVFRTAMLEWARYVSEGVPLDQAAQQARTPPILPGMLRTARDSAGSAEVFAFLSRYYDGRHGKAAALLEGAAIPVMVLVMAAFVLTLALALFLPMVKLMEHLSAGKWVM